MQVYTERTSSGTGEFATITYDREAKLNALHSEGISQLSRSFDSIADDSSVRAVILKGAGKRAFVGGADITELSNLEVDTAKIFILSLIHI